MAKLAKWGRRTAAIFSLRRAEYSLRVVEEIAEADLGFLLSSTEIRQVQEQVRRVRLILEEIR